MTQSEVRSPKSEVRGPQRSFPDWPAGFAEAIEQLALAARRPASALQPGAVRSRARGRALEFADHRPYSPGDDPRLVDWRAYARLDRLYLKQFLEERSRTLTLLLDASASLDWGDGAAHKGRYARQIAAALAWIGVSRHEPVRTYVLRDGAAAALQPAATRGEAAALFRQLGEVQDGGRTDLPGALRRVAAGSGGRSHGPVVLVTDLLDATWPDALRALAVFAAGNSAGGASGESDGGVVQVLAPDEWAPALGDEVELEDAETGDLRPSRLGPAELAGYRARLETFLGDVRATCRRFGLRHVALDTGAPLQQTVLHTLPAGGVLQ